MSGIGAYTRELIRQLVLQDNENEYVLFFDDGDRMNEVMAGTGAGRAARFRAHLLPYGPFSPRGQFELPGLFRELQLDVFHSTNYMIPLFAFPRKWFGLHRKGHKGTRCVVTIHDVIPLVFPLYAPRSKKARLFPVYRRLMMEVGARADRILTDSRASHDDVVRHLHIPAVRHHDVQVIPIGVAPEFKPGPRPAPVHKTILYVGRLDPYKNVPGLIRVLSRVRALSPLDVRLKIAGPPDPRYPEAMDLAKELGLHHWIEWTGYLSADELVRAYQQADVFALLSKYEGFGLPVLEAMASGTPVVCSRCASLPEVAGDAALLVDPTHIDEAADAILRILNDEALAAALRGKGLRQAAQFTWAKTAEATLDAYRRVVSE